MKNLFALLKNFFRVVRCLVLLYYRQPCQFCRGNEASDNDEYVHHRNFQYEPQCMNTRGELMNIFFRPLYFLCKNLKLTIFIAHSTHIEMFFLIQKLKTILRACLACLHDEKVQNIGNLYLLQQCYLNRLLGGKKYSTKLLNWLQVCPGLLRIFQNCPNSQNEKFSSYNPLPPSWVLTLEKETLTIYQISVVANYCKNQSMRRVSR